jgi:hypothetical protein
VGEIMNMNITAIRSKLTESSVETQKVVLVRTTGSLATEDVFGELLGVLRTDELLIVRSSYVYQSANGR